MRLIAVVARSYPRPLVVALLTLVFATATRAQATARAQDTTATANLKPTPEGAIVVLSLIDGSALQGRVVEVTATTIRFQSAIGETSIPRSAVREVHAAAEGPLHDGELWPEDPSRTRLFFAPTGRTLRRGDGYLADAYVFFPSVQYGVTDALTMGAGMSLIPGLGLDQQVYYLTPKLGVVSGPELNSASAPWSRARRGSGTTARSASRTAWRPSAARTGTSRRARGSPSPAVTRTTRHC